MPLTSAEHAMRGSRLFYGDCCPTTTGFLRTGAGVQVSPKNVFRLIAHVGEDCAGAVQFVRPERLEALQSDTVSKEVKWLTVDDVPRGCVRCARIILHGAVLKTRDNSASPGHNPRPLFSRAQTVGCSVWPRPNYAYPKPPTGEMDGHAENEHFSLRLAGAGLIVPNSTSSISATRSRLCRAL